MQKELLEDKSRGLWQWWVTFAGLLVLAPIYIAHAAAIHLKYESSAEEQNQGSLVVSAIQRYRWKTQRWSFHIRV